MGVGVARARGLSDAFRRRAGRRHDGVLAGPSCRGFVHNALTGPRAAGAPRGARGRRDTTDTGAYVVTGFIDLREQRRTCGDACARDVVKCSLAAKVLICGRRAPRSAPARPLAFVLKTLNCSPMVRPSVVRAACSIAAFNSRTASRGQAQCDGMRPLAAEASLARVPLVSRRKPGRASVLQWR